MIDTKDKLLASIAHAIRAFERSQHTIVGVSLDIPGDNTDTGNREKFYWDGEKFSQAKSSCND